MRPGTPVTLIPLTVADSAIQLRVSVDNVGLMNAKPSEEMLTLKPYACAVPPFTPRKAVPELTPMVKAVAPLTGVPPVRVRSEGLAAARQSCPMNWAKPPTWMFIEPESSKMYPLKSKV